MYTFSESIEILEKKRLLIKEFEKKKAATSEMEAELRGSLISELNAILAQVSGMSAPIERVLIGMHSKGFSRELVMQNGILYLNGKALTETGLTSANCLQ